MTVPPLETVSAHAEPRPGIPWSSPDTASSLLAAAEALGLIGASLPELRDLDTLADLTFHRRAFGWG